jgi:hypothetical protein
LCSGTHIPQQGKHHNQYRRAENLLVNRDKRAPTKWAHHEQVGHCILLNFSERSETAAGKFQLRHAHDNQAEVQTVWQSTSGHLKIQYEKLVFQIMKHRRYGFQ